MNNFWIFKFFLVSVFFLFNVYMGFFNNDLSTLQASMHALFAGVALLSLGMCVYHDASHFALYARSFEKNDVFARIMGSLFFWRSELWMMHHSFRHHTYTGDTNLDPDVVNYQPVIRKTELTPKKKYLPIPACILPFLTTIFLLVFPG